MASPHICRSVEEAHGVSLGTSCSECIIVGSGQPEARSMVYAETVDDYS